MPTLLQKSDSQQGHVTHTSKWERVHKMLSPWSFRTKVIHNIDEDSKSFPIRMDAANLLREIHQFYNLVLQVRNVKITVKCIFVLS